jgi:hypothetical protein
MPEGSNRQSHRLKNLKSHILYSVSTGNSKKLYSAFDGRYLTLQKSQLFLFLMKHHIIKTYCAIGGITPCVIKHGDRKVFQYIPFDFERILWSMGHIHNIQRSSKTKHKLFRKISSQFSFPYTVYQLSNYSGTVAEIEIQHFHETYP